MNKDDKCLRETVMAELRRRRGLPAGDEDRIARDVRADGRVSEAERDRREQRANPR